MVIVHLAEKEHLSSDKCSAHFNSHTSLLVISEQCDPLNHQTPDSVDSDDVNLEGSMLYDAATLSPILVIQNNYIFYSLSDINSRLQQPATNKPTKYQTLGMKVAPVIDNA